MMRSITNRKAARAALACLVWLAVWQAAAAYVGQQLLLPSPAETLRELARLLPAPETWKHAGLTLGRVFSGTLAGTACGLLCAGLTSFSRLGDCVLSPAMRVVRATPVASFIVLVLLWAPTGRVPAVISALMVAPVVWGGVCRGVRETDAQLLEMARAYRFSRIKTLRLVIAPSCLPYFVSSVRTALGLSWKAGVAAEVLCRPEYAIGSQVYSAKINLESPSLFAWTILVIALSFALEKGVFCAMQRVLRQKGGQAC